MADGLHLNFVQFDGLGSSHQGQQATSPQAAPSMSERLREEQESVGRMSVSALPYPEYVLEAVSEAAASRGMSFETFLPYFEAGLVACSYMDEVRGDRT
jgi:hypothetical protein